MPFGHAARPCRAYRYGADVLAGEGAVLAELRERTRLWNALVELDHDLRERREQAVAGYLADHPPEGDDEGARRAARKGAFADEGVRAALAALEDEAQGRSRELARSSPLWWCNRDDVRTTWLQARRGREALRFHRASGDGTLTIRRSGGWPVDALLAGDLAGGGYVRLEPADPLAWSHPVRAERRRRCRTGLVLQVASQGPRDPILAELVVHLHRPMPAGGTVQEVTLVREALAGHCRWSVVFVVALPEGELPEGYPGEPASPGARPAGTPSRSGTGWGTPAPPRECPRTVAVELGWRAVGVPRPAVAGRGSPVPGGLRVAVWRDEDGRTGEEVLPLPWLAAMGHVDELRSERDRRLDAARPTFLRALQELPDRPDWLAEAARTLSAWRSAARFAGLARRWRDARFPGDETAYAALEGWRREDRRRWEEQEHLRDKLLLQRRERYRVLAARLVREYGRIALEAVDWSRLARRKRAPAPSEDTPPSGDELAAAARRNRVLAALSTLELALEQAAAREGRALLRVEAKHATATCAECGSVEVWDRRELRHRCGGCGAEWDQDHNAARILLRRALDREPATGETAPEVAGFAGPSSEARTARAP